MLQSTRTEEPGTASRVNKVSFYNQQFGKKAIKASFNKLELYKNSSMPEN